jgi:tetratricopeptide (TPR) repeat protein
MRPTIALLLAALISTVASCSRGQSGEEAMIVFRAADGRTLTMDELSKIGGTFQYEILGTSNIPAEARRLHQQAREAGGSGDYKNAIALLQRASILAPTWPYPVYDLAYTYLLMKDVDNARKFYRKTVELAPRGFFTAITALDALDREAKGDLPPGTYLTYLSLEWIDDPAKKEAVIHQMVKRIPKFAPIWREQAMFAQTDAEKLVDIDNGLAANPDSETKGILQINRALIIDRGGDHAGAVRMLGELALDPASTYATEHLARVTLANVAARSGS